MPHYTSLIGNIWRPISRSENIYGRGSIFSSRPRVAYDDDNDDVDDNNDDDDNFDDDNNIMMITIMMMMTIRTD